MSSTADYAVPTTSGTSGVDVDITRHRFTEAKDGFKTSEFYVMVVFVAAVLLAPTLTPTPSLAMTAGASLGSRLSPTSSMSLASSLCCTFCFSFCETVANSRNASRMQSHSAPSKSKPSLASSPSSFAQCSRAPSLWLLCRVY